MAAFLDDAVLVASEFIDRLAGQNQLDLVGFDQLLKGGKGRLVAVILRHIQPHTGIYEKAQHVVGFLQRSGGKLSLAAHDTRIVLKALAHLAYRQAASRMVRDCRQ